MHPLPKTPCPWYRQRLINCGNVLGKLDPIYDYIPDCALDPETASARGIEPCSTCPRRALERLIQTMKG